MTILFLFLIYVLSRQAAALVLASSVSAQTAPPTVVIDSGHGGNDPGKIGVDGSLEKDLNLTIARKLKPGQYEKGWLEYSHRHFSGRFIAEGMTLLRRPEGEGKFQPLLQFCFQNLPVVTRQGDLFG